MYEWISASNSQCIAKGKVKAKQSLYGLGRPSVLQEVEVPRLQDNRHKKAVRSSAIHTGCLYPQEIFLLLISFRG